MEDCYDVFVSYSHCDADWVRQELLPRLEGAGLKVCIDYRDFDIGIPAQVNMANAVRRSRCAVPIVTPEWTKSRYAGFETLSATRVMPVLLGDCEVPAEIKALTYADLRTPANRPAELNHLIDQLKTLPAQPPVPVPGPSQPDSGSLRAVLSAVCERLDTVGDYKDIHDQFHEMQYQCYDCLLRNLARLPQERPCWDELFESAAIMLEIVERLRQIAGHFPLGDRSWFQGVQDVAALLRDGAAEENVDKLKECRRKMTPLLARQPTKIVVRLNEAARALLPDLKRVDTALDPDVPAPLEPRLAALIERHDQWQELDSLLRSTDPELHDPDAWWPDVERQARQVVEGSGESWVPAFVQALSALAASIPTGDAARIGRDFRAFKRLAALRFHRADSDLKRTCDEMRRVDGPYGFLRMTP